MEAPILNHPIPGSAARDKLIKESQNKQYKQKLKRHKDSVMALYAQDGISDKYLISGDAD